MENILPKSKGFCYLPHFNYQTETVPDAILIYQRYLVYM